MTSKGTQLLLNGAYEEAVEPLVREDKRDWQDDFRACAIFDLGTTLTLMRRFEEAEQHFRGLIPQVRYTVSAHRIMIGISFWYRGRHAEAVSEWEKATKCGYCGNSGLDGAVALYFAAVLDPDVAKLERAFEQLAKVEKRLGDNFYPIHIAQFMRRAITRDEFLALMSQSEGKFAKHWQRVQLTLAAFYIALDAKRDDDDATFLTELQRCAEATKVESMYDEMVFARLECQARGMELDLPARRRTSPKKATDKSKKVAATTARKTAKVPSVAMKKKGESAGRKVTKKTTARRKLGT